MWNEPDIYSTQHHATSRLMSIDSLHYAMDDFLFNEAIDEFQFANKILLAISIPHDMENRDLLYIPKNLWI